MRHQRSARAYVLKLETAARSPAVIRHRNILREAVFDASSACLFKLCRQNFFSQEAKLGNEWGIRHGRTSLSTSMHMFGCGINPDTCTLKAVSCCRVVLGARGYPSTPLAEYNGFASHCSSLRQLTRRIRKNLYAAKNEPCTSLPRLRTEQRQDGSSKDSTNKCRRRTRWWRPQGPKATYKRRRWYAV